MSVTVIAGYTTCTPPDGTDAFPVNRMMAVLSAVAVLLLSTLCSVVATTPTRLKALSISAVEKGGSVVYSIMYESPSQAETMWEYGEKIYVTARNTFSQGQGQSELVVGNPVYGLVVYLSLPGTMQEYYYVFGEINQLAVSDTSIRFSPDHISYIPGVPIDISVEIEIEDPDLYSQPYVVWYFVGINSSSADAPVQVVTSYDALAQSIARTFSHDTHANQTVYSSSLTLSSEEGLVFVYTTFSSKSYLPTFGSTAVAYLKHRDHVGPFPANFVGVYSLSDVFDGKKTCHERNFCSIDCSGVGPDIVNVELRKGKHGRLLDPVVSTRREYVQRNRYQIFPVTRADEGTYFCIATGRNGETAEKQINVDVQ